MFCEELEKESQETDLLVVSSLGRTVVLIESMQESLEKCIEGSCSQLLPDRMLCGELKQESQEMH